MGEHEVEYVLVGAPPVPSEKADDYDDIALDEEASAAEHMDVVHEVDDRPTPTARMEFASFHRSPTNRWRITGPPTR